MSDDLRMWRERAEAAEDEVRMLRASGLHHRAMIDATEVYSLAVRLVSLSALCAPDVILRAVALLRSVSEAADDEDAAAMRAIIRVVERRADPETWHAQVKRELDEVAS